MIEKNARNFSNLLDREFVNYLRRTHTNPPLELQGRTNDGNSENFFQLCHGTKSYIPEEPALGN